MSTLTKLILQSAVIAFCIFVLWRVMTGLERLAVIIMEVLK